jgi:deoxyribodipyrimidine photo-lyase
MEVVPQSRIRPGNDRPVREDGDFVLYWMIANRRVRYNFSLQHAVDRARELRKPLVILEALRCGYRWASDRHHAFILQGMADNAEQLKRKNVQYHPYVERESGEGKGLLAALAELACVVITDEYPCFFLPRMVEAASRQVPVRLEVVDAIGLLPMRAAEKTYTSAYNFRRFLQKSLKWHLERPPRADPFARVRLPRSRPLPRRISGRWPRATRGFLQASPGALAGLPIDHTVPPAALTGGPAAGRKQLAAFLDQRLYGYAERRNHPDADHTSGLSPYLHFGHISVHEVFDRLAKAQGWSTRKLSGKARGGRVGWWGMGADAEAFLDQLVTWRELGFNLCSREPGYDQYESLPDWALRTLGEHEGDPRPHIYTREQLDRANTHDPLWNAAQTQLVREGRIHGYLRMLWGKMILAWSASPWQALTTMIGLNNRYALDGRDPNSYGGIFWCLGRYDRAWGPERPVFGKIRYMTSANTARKYKSKNYIKKYSPSPDS